MKKGIKIGMIVGAVVGVIVSIGMDFAVGPSLGGSWNQVIANDINRLFNTSFSSTHIVVLAGVVLVIAMISGFGAILGGICIAIIIKTFTILTKEQVSD